MMLSKFKTIEQLAASLRTIFGFGKFGVYARVYNSGDLTIGTGSWTSLTFDSERWDPQEMHSTVSNTGRLTAVVSGLYLAIGHAVFEANATGERYFRITKGISSSIAQNNYDGHSVAIHGIVTTQMYMNAGEYLTFDVYQNSGGDLDILQADYYTPEFMMCRIV